MTSDPREPAPVPPTFDEFYIGYAPPMPPHIARFVKRAALTIAAGVPLAAALVAIGHIRVDGGVFDYGRPRTIAGVIATRPYPAIRLEPSSTSEEGDVGGDRWALLVAPGKHGAGALAAPFDGQRVTLDATRIQRGGAVMFEVAPGTIAATPKASTEDRSEAAVASASPHAGAPVTLRGEIVDSKCFLGVMVPGEGKTHKDCASLCLRGGIPPAFIVRDREGRSALMLLVSESGGSLAGHAAASRLAGEPIELTGVIEEEIVEDASVESEITPSAVRERRRDWRVLRTNPSTWRPLSAQSRRR
jgi:hypothetical protein